jgi:hypothetical protein
MNLVKISKNATQFKALTSLSLEEFEALLPNFYKAWQAYIKAFTLDGLPRVRPYKPSANEPLPTSKEKLFFILTYLKNSPLQEYHAAAFGLPQATANTFIHILEPLIKQSLQDFQPATSQEQLQEQLQEGKDYLVDVTERAVQRDTYHQQAYYSGKKRTHTVKNLLITCFFGFILFVSPTAQGHKHDKKMMDSIHIDKPITLYTDLGFYGLKSTKYVIKMPHKKPKKKELTTIQKKENQLLASTRVKIEHHFAHLKTLRIIKDKNRNYKVNFRENVILTACCLHNFRLQFRLKKKTIYL